MSETPITERPAWPVVQFRLAHLLYALALFGSCLALFETAGIGVAIVILVFWGYVFSSRSRPRALLKACLALLVGFCLLGLVLPAIPVARESSRWTACANNLKMITLALQNYHDTYGEFPPACIRDRDGQPMHSWRVLLLPFLEQRNLYEKYRFDEPWNGPNNRRLLDQLSGGPYECPSDPRGAGQGPKWTSYVAVVGPHTAWGATRGRRLSELPDGAANTVMVVEYQGNPIAWLEPRDLELNEALSVLTSPAPDKAGLHRSEDFFFEYLHGRHVGCADARVHFVYQGVGQDVWSALLTIDDGVKLSDLDLNGPWRGIRRVKVGNWLQLGLFVVLTLWPLPWVWREPQAFGRRSNSANRWCSASEKPGSTEPPFNRSRAE